MKNGYGWSFFFLKFKRFDIYVLCVCVGIVVISCVCGYGCGFWDVWGEIMCYC